MDQEIILNNAELRRIKLVRENQEYKAGSAPALRGDKFAVIVVKGIVTTIPQSAWEDKKAGKLAEMVFSSQERDAVDDLGNVTKIPGLQFQTSATKAEVLADADFDGKMVAQVKKYDLSAQSI